MLKILNKLLESYNYEVIYDESCNLYIVQDTESCYNGVICDNLDEVEAELLHLCN